MLTRRFFYVSLGILALALAYHVGAARVTAQAPSDPRCVPVFYQEAVRGWLDLETGAYRVIVPGLYGEGVAPAGTRTLLISQSGNCGGPTPYALYAVTAEGHEFYAYVLNCDPWTVSEWAETLLPCPSVVVSVAPQSSGTVAGERFPKSGRLSFPRPNPFNPSTEIAFTLATDGPVDVSIYSPSGQLVRRLVDERLGAGSHAVAWDGRDDSGRSVPAGTYLYQLRVDGRVVGSEKAVVIR
jgi:FlgD Ig-like domain